MSRPRFLSVNSLLFRASDRVKLTRRDHRWIVLEDGVVICEDEGPSLHTVALARARQVRLVLHDLNATDEQIVAAWALASTSTVSESVWHCIAAAVAGRLPVPLVEIG